MLTRQNQNKIVIKKIKNGIIFAIVKKRQQDLILIHVKERRE